MRLEEISWKDGKFFDKSKKEVIPVLVYPPLIEETKNEDSINKLINHLGIQNANAYSIREITINENGSFKNYLYSVAILKI